MNHSIPAIRTTQCSIHPALRSLIRNIVMIDTDFGNASIKMEGNYMPSPDQAMFINLFTTLQSKKSGEQHFNKASSCTLMGAQVTPFKLLAQESNKTVSIIFQPGGLNRFLAIPITEIFDNGYAAREVIGQEIEELLNKCHDSTSWEELNQFVQSYFLKKLSRIKEELPIDHALQYLLTHHNTSLDKIAAMACMSTRNFERKCKERLGMPAKMYARITRFHKAYQMLQKKTIISWTDLTYELGYYDQTHFIKDFKEFARLTPTLVHKELSAQPVQFQMDWERI